MKHLVLGSEGQIGRYVCDEIESRGDEAIRWDVSISAWHDLSNVNHNHGFRQKLDEADFVHFLAYNVGGSKYLAQHQNSYEYIAHNTRLMENVFNQLWLTKKPFYFASSQMSNMTDSVYGQLKAVGESYTKALGGVNVKFWNVYGYESDLEKSHVITDFIRMAFEEDRIIARTNGEEKRHFTYAPDAAKMLYHIARNYEESLDYTYGKNSFRWNRDKSIHVVNGIEPWYSMIQVGEAVMRQVQYYKENPDFDCYNMFMSRTEDKTQTIQNEWIDPYRLLESTGPYVRLEDGIREMVKLIGKDYA